MKTPLFDFVKKYSSSSFVRLHMPGHKGYATLGCEPFDITEINGADELYAPCGIIQESESIASSLFGTAQTLYSTEGSSQCIRAMIYIASLGDKSENRYILAARNAHKTLIYALALSDIGVSWLLPSASTSLCSCEITANDVDTFLSSAKHLPMAVYITTPDYLGVQLDVKSISDVCHKYGVPLIVDNAHGAYLKFLNNTHPIDLGADICCDSAHKTLTALTGGAYLHISKSAPKRFLQNAKNAMALFGSTSPSYLILASLDKCNEHIENGLHDVLCEKANMVLTARQLLHNRGWKTIGTEPLKLTLACPPKINGNMIANTLRSKNIECEYVSPEHIVIMISQNTSIEDISAFVSAVGGNKYDYANEFSYRPRLPKAVMSIRQAIFSESETVDTDYALGRICAAPTVSCPPAIPIAVSGEIIGSNEIELFKHYGINSISVIKQ